jgi:hypothetical protein
MKNGGALIPTPQVICHRRQYFNTKAMEFPNRFVNYARRPDILNVTPHISLFPIGKEIEDDFNGLQKRKMNELYRQNKIWLELCR